MKNHLEITNFVADYLQESVDDLLSTKRESEVSRCRAILVHALVRHSELDFKDICKFIGRTANTVAGLSTRGRKQLEWKKIDAWCRR